MRNFKKIVEDFECENCRAEVQGNGYTNHCPKCLHSKHVDESFPGDRASNCLGLMKPVALSLKGGQPEKVLFRCIICGMEKYNKISKNDNLDVLRSLEVM